MLVAARAGAQMKMCPEPGQEYALATAMVLAGYQFLKLSWEADDTDGVSNRRRILWLFQLPQVAAPPLGMFGDDDDFGGNGASSDHADSSDDDAAADSEMRDEQQRGASTGTDASTAAASAHRSSADNMASASVSGHHHTGHACSKCPIRPSNMVSAQSLASVHTTITSI
jgi:hypothetical protein